MAELCGTSTSVMGRKQTFGSIVRNRSKRTTFCRPHGKRGLRGVSKTICSDALGKKGGM